MLEEKNVGGKNVGGKKSWMKNSWKNFLEAKNLRGNKSALPLTSPPRKLQGWVEGQSFYFLLAKMKN